MTQSSGSTDLDTIRQLLFGAEVTRLDQQSGADRQTAQLRAAELEQRLEQSVADLERRLGQRLDEMSQRVAAQLDDLSRRQQAHAEKATQLLDQVMAELGRRTDSLTAETRAGIEELRARAAELERRKLNVTDFGASLASLGQRFSAGQEGG